MSALNRLVPDPGLVQLDSVVVAADPLRTWDVVRNINLAQSPLVRTLFGIRTIPDRLEGRSPELQLHIHDLVSTPERPGFQVLVEEPPRELAAGAIGQVWRPVIPFIHVPDAAAYSAFAEPGYVKVAWAIRALADGDSSTRVEFELRVAATDEASWTKFKRYFMLIGPASHFMRRLLLAQIERDLGTPQAVQNERRLPGDELLPDAAEQFTHSIEIDAPPDRVWPWLVQMGCRRAGFYSIDALDNGGVPSAREIIPELQRLAVGDRIPAQPEGDDYFEVLALEPYRALLLGSLFDVEAQHSIGFRAARPARYWHVSWAFVLEPLADGRTRLYARVRGAFPRTERFHAFWIRPVHHLMQTMQLRHLAARAEGRVSDRQHAGAGAA
jgi:hypothetical protein